MKLPSSLTTVTPFSKLIALFLIIIFPLAGFYLGIMYQEMNSPQTQQSPVLQTNKLVPYPTQTLLPTIDPNLTADWKTYTNKNLDYAVKYPEGFTAIVKESDVAFFISGEENKENKMYKFAGKHIGIYYQHESEQPLSPKEVIKKIRPDAPTKEVSVNNASGLQITDMQFSYYLRRKNNIGPTLTLSIFAPDGTVQSKEEFDQFLLVANQILSTFRFLDTGVMEAMSVEPCDLNEDGQCDLADRTLFNKALGSKRGDLNYNPFADADADGTITIVDQQMLFPTTLPATPTPSPF